MKMNMLIVHRPFSSDGGSLWSAHATITNARAFGLRTQKRVYGAQSKTITTTTAVMNRRKMTVSTHTHTIESRRINSVHP